MLQKSLSLLAIALLLALHVHAQFLLEGRVTDLNGKPLAGASVLVHELQRGTVTDAYGVYRFERMRPGRYHLHFYYLGFEAQRVDLQISTNLVQNVRLQPSSLELREIIVENDLTKADESRLTQSTEMLGEEQLRRYAGLTLMQGLERLPGVQSINTGIGISKPVIRGLSFNRVVVAENGVKQEGQQWGIDHGLELDQFNVGRVEVLKGPASLLYGSDAMAGVIQVKPALLPVGDSLSGSVTLLGRSVNDHVGGSAVVQGQGKQGWVYRARLTAHQYGDYKLPADSFTYNRFIIPIPDARLENTAGEELHGSAMVGLHRKWGYSQLNWSSFNQQIGFFPGAIGRPLGYRVVNDGNRRNIALPNQHIRHHKMSWNSSVILGKNWLEADLGWQRNVRDERSLPHNHGRPFLDSSTNVAHGLDLQTLSYNVRYHLQLDSSKQLLIGSSGQWQENVFSGYEFLIPNYSSRQLGAFALLQWQYNRRLFVNAGLRYDVGWLQSAAFRESLLLQGVWTERQRAPEIDRFFGNASGAVGMSYQLSKNINLKANAGSSFRLPTIPELTSNGVHHGSFRHEMGDSTLRPERGWQLDLAANYRSSRWEVKLSPYFNYFSNYIYLRPTGIFTFLPEGGTIFQYTQGRVLHTGTELQVEYHLLDNLHLALLGEYVWMRNLDTRLPLPWTSPATLTWEVAYEFEKAPKWLQKPVLGVDWKLVARQNRVDRNEDPTPAYNLLNVQAGGEIKLGKQSLQLRFLVNNLLNVRYLNHLSRFRLLNLPDPGRNVQLMLSVPF